MPDGDVTLTFKFSAIIYNVSADTSLGGSAVLSASTAIKGQEVIIDVAPDAGWQLSQISATDAGGNVVAVEGSGTSYTLKMPASDVVINVVFEKINYTISLGSPANGTLSANVESAGVGDTVTITALPATSEYALENMTIEGPDGMITPVHEGGTTYSF